MDHKVDKHCTKSAKKSNKEWLNRKFTSKWVKIDPKMDKKDIKGPKDKKNLSKARKRAKRGSKICPKHAKSQVKAEQKWIKNTLKAAQIKNKIHFSWQVFFSWCITQELIKFPVYGVT